GMDDALPHLGGYHPLAAALATSIAQPLGGAFGNRLFCSSWLTHRRLRSRRRIPLCCGFGSLVPGFRFGHAPPPQGRGLAINVQLPADLAVAMPLTGQQDNPSPLRQLLGGVSSPRQRLQSSTHCVVDEYCQCHGLSEHTSRKMSSFDCGFTLARRTHTARPDASLPADPSSTVWRPSFWSSSSPPQLPRARAAATPPPAASGSIRSTAVPCPDLATSAPPPPTGHFRIASRSTSSHSRSASA